MAGLGGAIKLTGADEYKKAIDAINLSLKAVSSEMKAVSSSFDAGDLSEERLKEETESLNGALKSQKDLLASLEGQMASMKAEYDANSKKHAELVSQYDAEKKKLDQIGKTLGESSQEYKAQEKVVQELNAQVTASEKTLNAQTQSLDKMRVSTANATTTINTMRGAMEELDKETGESGEDAEEASKGFTIFKGVLANLATQAINGVINGLQRLGQAFVDVGKSAIEGYASFEQLEGGVQKLFGSDAEAVIQNANNAFKSAGMSVNEYMETVTNFSASLISGLGGDTAKATAIADTAIRDMADNANTFGTSIESIQSAYQGFAKGNFSMLDNLKLGYGGTKTEMLRLVKDAGVVKDSVKSLDEVTFDQMIEAIHIMQEEMNISGTTAKEASGTIEGSISSMKSAWQNLLIGIADENSNFGALVDNFISTLVDENGGGVIGNLMPRIATVIQGIGQLVTTMIPQLAVQIAPIIEGMTPVLLDAVSGVLQSIVALLPTILPIIAQLIPEICQTLIALLPQIVDVGIDFILALIDGIADALPQLIQMLPKIIMEIVKKLLERLPDILSTGFKLMLELGKGIWNAVKDVVGSVAKVIKAVLEAIGGAVSDMVSAGRNLVEGLWQGLKNSISWLKNKIKEWVGDVTKFIKRLFGIASPSKVFRDEIGENLALGLGEGFMDEMKHVSKEMGDAIPTDFDIDAGVKAKTGAVTGYDLVAQFKEALSEMKIELDDEQVGRFVDNTVARLVYA